MLFYYLTLLGLYPIEVLTCIELLPPGGHYGLLFILASHPLTSQLSNHNHRIASSCQLFSAATFSSVCSFLQLIIISAPSVKDDSHHSLYDIPLDRLAGHQSIHCSFASTTPNIHHQNCNANELWTRNATEKHSSSSVG